VREDEAAEELQDDEDAEDSRDYEAEPAENFAVVADEEADDADGAYFVMRCEGVRQPADVVEVTDWLGPPWMTGQPMDRPVPNPFILRVNPSYRGRLLPMYQSTVLIMRDDLIQVLQEAGVDNLEIFPALIRDEKINKERTNYKAVNIVGLVSAADMAQSSRMDPTSTNAMIDVDFDSLVLDESKTGGALLFRLAESVNAIVVHRSVRDRVRARIPGMTFYASGEWSG
jgi:hypothetical protein